MADHREDPRFRRSQREAWVILSILAVTTAAALSICYAAGYRVDRGVRARRGGQVRLVADEARPRFVEIAGKAFGADRYDIPAGYATKVEDGQLVAAGVLLASPAERPGRVAMVIGLPAWVVWGVLLPWAVCGGVTLWFAVSFVRDDDTSGPDAPAAGGDHA